MKTNRIFSFLNGSLVPRWRLTGDDATAADKDLAVVNRMCNVQADAIRQHDDSVNARIIASIWDKLGYFLVRQSG